MRQGSDGTVSSSITANDFTIALCDWPIAPVVFECVWAILYALPRSPFLLSFWLSFGDFQSLSNSIFSTWRCRANEVIRYRRTSLSFFCSTSRWSGIIVRRRLSRRVAISTDQDVSPTYKDISPLPLEIEEHWNMYHWLREQEIVCTRYIRSIPCFCVWYISNSLHCDGDQL